MSASKMDPERKKVFYYAAGSRIVFLLFAFISDLILPNYHSDAFITASFTSDEVKKEDSFVWKLFGGLLQWDAHHYLHIAEFGYTFENNIPFFPLFPFLINLGGLSLRFFNLTERILSSHLLCAVLLNNVMFVKSALVLYDLTLFIFNDTKFSFRTSIFYCVSPATVFFIAPYSETLFSYCAFKGMQEFSRRRMNLSLLWFFLSACIRSNGITFAGFILHAWAYYCLTQLSFSSTMRKLRLILRFTIFTLQYVLIMFCPFLIFQLYCYVMFCHLKSSDHLPLITDHADKYKLSMVSDYIGWCYNGVNVPYFVVQEKFWDVGLLRYYELKQIPNFLLAFPVCYLVIFNGVLYLKKNWTLFFNPKKIYNFVLIPHEPKRVRNDYPPTVFLFFMHALILNIWGLVNINVQVLTRLLASCSPIIYWIAANKFEGLVKKANDKSSLLENFILLPFEKGLELDTESFMVKWYFIGYALVGIVMFTNGLPWT